MISEQVKNEIIEKYCTFNFSDYDGRSYWECSLCDAVVRGNVNISNLHHTNDCPLTIIATQREELNVIKKFLNGIRSELDKIKTEISNLEQKK